MTIWGRRLKQRLGVAGSVRQTILLVHRSMEILEKFLRVYNVLFEATQRGAHSFSGLSGRARKYPSNVRKEKSFDAKGVVSLETGHLLTSYPTDIAFFDINNQSTLSRCGSKVFSKGGGELRILTIVCK